MVQAFHALTQLLGQLSMIVDIGAWTNLMGANLARKLAQRAIDCGYKPRQTRIERPLNIHGVGSGAQQC